MYDVALRKKTTQRNLINNEVQILMEHKTWQPNIIRKQICYC